MRQAASAKSPATPLGARVEVCRPDVLRTVDCMDIILAATKSAWQVL